MKVFWSWQNDVSPSCHRHFLKACLDEAVEMAGQDLNLDAAARRELDHDTKGQPEMAEIAAATVRKNAEASAFVADVTPIGRSESGKALPNPQGFLFAHPNHGVRLFTYRSIIEEYCSLILGTLTGGPFDRPALLVEPERSLYLQPKFSGQILYEETPIRTQIASCAQVKDKI